MVIPMVEDMEDMARDLLTLARRTLSRTEELQRLIPRLIPRLMLKQDSALEAMEDSTGEVCMEASVVLVWEVWAWDMEDMEDCTEEVCMAVVFMVAMDSGRINY